MERKYRVIFSIVIIMIDIYILGTFDLIEPIYFGIVFLVANYLWFRRYWNKSR